MRQSQDDAKKLKNRVWLAIIALILAFLAAASATYAWYIYNTGKRTTSVRLAAGAGSNLQISNTYDSGYGSRTPLSSFVGELIPVSTDYIQNGFQRVTKFVDNNTGVGANILADRFAGANGREYYKTSLYIRTNGPLTDVYISDISYEDDNPALPISTAVRVGFVVHTAGENTPPKNEYIFSITENKNPEAEYNTATGREGYVLDSRKTDGTTVEFKHYTGENYCIYKSADNSVTLKENSLKICKVGGTAEGKPGTPVQIDVYIWLEGCDEDCTNNLSAQTLKNLAISFAGVKAN